MEKILSEEELLKLYMATPQFKDLEDSQELIDVLEIAVTLAEQARHTLRESALASKEWQDYDDARLLRHFMSTK